jgi:hypothetical protein
MKRLAGGLIGVAAALPALGYAGAGNWLGCAASVAIGCLWLVGLYRSWAGIETLGLFAVVGLAAAGTRSVAAPMLLASVVVALAAWDWQRFMWRLDNSGQVLDQPALARAHLRWSLGVAGAGLLLGLLAPLIAVPLPFGATLMLGVLLVLGLSRAIGGLNRRT